MALIREDQRESRQEALARQKRAEEMARRANARRFQEELAAREAQTYNISVSPQREPISPDRFNELESATMKARGPAAYAQPQQSRPERRQPRQEVYAPEPRNVVDQLGESSSYIADLAPMSLDRWDISKRMIDPYQMAAYRAGEWMQDNSPFGRPNRDMSDLPPNPYRRAAYWAQERLPIRPNVLGWEDGFYDENGDPWPARR